ncbi:sulfite exporter TauE/SafE family protein [Janibacter sp. LM]|uniref:sulfite exporter TauE/SafE family protein n=1 Tax=Janibacter sp. LM TaxID=3144845 RepID=UPI0031F60C2B
MIALDPTVWGLLVVGAFVGAAFQGMVGFGLAFTVVPLLAVVEPLAIPTVPLLLTLPMVVGNMIADLAHIDLRGSGLIVAGRVPGTLIGAGLLLIVRPEVLGIVVACALLASVLIGVREAPALTDRNRLAAGLASGIMGTAAGLGGPPVSMVYRGQPAAVFRATVSTALLAGIALSMAAVVVLDRGSQQHVLLSLALVPAAVLGLAVSRKWGRNVSGRRLQQFVLGLGGVAALATITQAVVNL